MGGWPPRYGGVSVSIKQCSEVWVNQGHEVHVLNFGRTGKHVRVVNGVLVAPMLIMREN